jgi:hypothetical protein
MRKFVPVRAVAVAALAASGGLASIAAVSGGVAGAKAPVAATCTGGYGSTSTSGFTSGVVSLLTGCTSTSTHVSTNGVNETTVSSDGTSGTGTVLWTTGKNTTYSFTQASGSATCPTYLDQSSALQLTITYTGVAGTAKVNANGGGDVCVYIGSDGTIYEQNAGSTTL